MWREIRKKPESIGISVAAFNANKGFILEWFQDALESGAFDEDPPDGDSGSISKYSGEEYVYPGGFHEGYGVQRPDAVLEQSFEPSRLEPGQTRTPSTEIRRTIFPRTVNTLPYVAEKINPSRTA